MDRTTGIILAGGWSKRFGRDKAEVIWNGLRFIDHVSQSLRAVCEEVVAVIRPNQYVKDWPVDRLIQDDTALPEGPLRGMFAGLVSVNHPAFIVACDSPMLHVDLLKLLQDEITIHDDAGVPVWNGMIQPLHGLYRPQCAAVFHNCLLAGESAPTCALPQLKCRIIDEAIVRGCDPDGLSFYNVNRPQEFERLREMTPGIRGRCHA